VLKYGQKRLVKLRKLVEEKDYVNYTIDVHALKSTAANIGATDLSQMALEHEQAGKTGDFSFIEENYELLLTLYETVLREIATVRKKEIQENVQDIKITGVEEKDAQVSEVQQLAEELDKEKDAGDINSVQVQHSLTDAELRSRLGKVIDMLDDFVNISGEQGPLIIMEKVASMSCKAAVKGHNRLSLEEATHLIDTLLTLENPYQCPHGRPTIISMTKYELEKKFKRIV